jgi:acylphosphatase
MIKRRILVKGSRVQDVGYRLFLYYEAENLGLAGLQARNVGKDVEILAEGEENCMNEFVKFIRENYPKHAEVEKVEVYDYNGVVMDIERYYRSLTVEQLAKIVDAGLGLVGGQSKMLKKQDSMLKKQDLMIQKQDEMLKKQDLMIQKQDEMLKKQDLMIQKQDLMIQKQDEMLNELRELRKDLKAFIDERFKRIEDEIKTIKEKIGLR